MTAHTNHPTAARGTNILFPLEEGRGEGISPTAIFPALCRRAEGEGPQRSFPSRYDNPFATCWTRPGAMAFRFPHGEGVEQLIDRFLAANCRGAVIGPHGSGKSTLLEALQPAFAAAGHAVSFFLLRAGQRRLGANLNELASGFRLAHAPAARPLIIVDGYEQLAWLERLKLLRACRRHRLGLLVTSHTVTCLPTLIRLAPDRQLVEQLVRGLCAQVSTHVAPEDVAASHACHGSNVREIFFDLYDRYERRRRHLRTPPAARS